MQHQLVCKKFIPVDIIVPLLNYCNSYCKYQQIPNKTLRKHVFICSNSNRITILYLNPYKSHAWYKPPLITIKVMSL